MWQFKHNENAKLVIKKLGNYWHILLTIVQAWIGPPRGLAAHVQSHGHLWEEHRKNTSNESSTREHIQQGKEYASGRSAQCRAVRAHTKQRTPWGSWQSQCNKAYTLSRDIRRCSKEMLSHVNTVLQPLWPLLITARRVKNVMFFSSSTGKKPESRI